MMTENADKKREQIHLLCPLGAGCEGVGAAAEKYFGKQVSELTLAECASLIPITNNPSKYGPFSLSKVANSEGELWDSKQWNKYRQDPVRKIIAKLTIANVCSYLIKPFGQVIVKYSTSEDVYKRQCRITL